MSIVVLALCFNKAATIVAVVRDFHQALTGRVHVFDNGSSDGTPDVAFRSGWGATNFPVALCFRRRPNPLRFTGRLAAFNSP
jgi:hypothetical protein